MKLITLMCLILSSLFFVQDDLQKFKNLLKERKYEELLNLIYKKEILLTQEMKEDFLNFKTNEVLYLDKLSNAISMNVVR